METRKILAVLFLALGLVVWPVEVSDAVPMGTAFTYQGSLNDAGSPASGVYDFEFRVYDDPDAGIQQGSTVTIDDQDVIDGYFSVELDFGSGVFDGEARWLEMTVAHSDGSDPCTLSPRQELTLTPYALYAEKAGGDNDWMVSDGNMYSIPPGNVGIGTTAPISRLEVVATQNKHGIRSTVPYIAVYGHRTGTAGTWPGVHGECDSLSSNTAGVRGLITSTSPGTNSAGVRGVNNGTGDKGAGVYGWHAGSGSGVYGYAAGPLGHGVYGNATATSSMNYGGYFKAAGTSGRGVYGEATGSNGYGVYGYASDSGFGSTQYGGFFKAEGTWGRGVYGLGTGTNARAVYGYASNSGDVTNYGGYFQAAGGSGRGVYGLATGDNGRGVWGYATYTGSGVNYGGYFQAEATVGIGVYSEAAGILGVGVRAKGKLYDFLADGDGTDYGSSSSIRWKTDIRPIDDPLEKVLRLRGVYFNWDAEHGGGHDVGMIAEEVGEVLPEIVGYEENGIDATGMDYGKLTPLLVEAVKALQKEADELRKQHKEKDVEIAAMKKANELIRARLAAMESVVGRLALSQEGGRQ